MPASTSEDRSGRAWYLASAAGVAIVVAFVVLLNSGAAPTAKESASLLGLIVGGAFLAVVARRRARASKGHRRRAWYSLAAAGFVAFATNVLATLAVLEPLASFESLPAQLDAGYLAALLLSVVGLVFMLSHTRGIELLRMLLDAMIVGGATLMIVSTVVFPQIIGGSANAAAPRLSLLFLPMIDVVLATLAVLVVARSSRDEQITMGLIAIGFLLYAGADMAYAAAVAQGGGALGGSLDVGWIAGYVALSLAALSPSRTAVKPSVPGGLDVTDPAFGSSTWAGSRAEDPETVAAERASAELVPAEAHSVLGTILIFSVVILAALVNVLYVQDAELTGQLNTAWVALLIGVTVRQTLLTLDNDALRRGLEERVISRTAQLHGLARRSQLVLSSVGDGIYGVDEHGKVTFVNPAAAGTLGYAPGELLHHNAHELFHARKPDGSAYPIEGCYVTEAIRDGVTTQGEEDFYVRADGREIPVEITATPLARDGEVSGAVVVFRDVTERREVDRIKGEFVAVVSHELRTPLTSIRGSLGLLAGGAMGALSAPVMRMVTIALESSERLTRLINDILDIERIESGALPMALTDNSAAALVETAIEQTQGLAGNAKVTLVQGPVQGMVRADQDRLVQTLINLIGNAVKFSSSGSTVRVSAEVVEREVVFRVADQGRGIPADKLESIFERFEQVDSSDARELGGTGLGLAISRSIIERHGGTIWADSELGKGTTVSFKIPLLREIPSALPAPQDGQWVLVCDDDAATVEVLTALLERRGYHCVGVTTGDEALALAKANPPAVVLLDVWMPGTNGHEVVTRLKAAPETHDTPIIIVSGLSPTDDRELSTSTDGWLVKPVEDDALARAVEAALHAHDSRRTVLVVEDDPDLSHVLSTLLERRGFEVTVARTGRQAIDVCRTLRPEVLVLDLSLPDGDGFDVVAALRLDGHLARTPLVVYTASELGTDARSRLSLGRTVFLTKGRSTPEDLETRVLELVDLVTGRSEGNLASAIPATARGQ